MHLARRIIALTLALAAALAGAEPAWFDVSDAAMPGPRVEVNLGTLQTGPFGTDLELRVSRREEQPAEAATAGTFFALLRFHCDATATQPPELLAAIGDAVALESAAQVPDASSLSAVAASDALLASIPPKTRAALRRAACAL